MKIEKIAKTAAPDKVPRIVWEWIARAKPEKQEKNKPKVTDDPEMSSGELVLYNRYGRKVIKDIKNHEYIKI